jgi:hypothetical protein
MVVTINGRTMDITLERERTLGEVLSGIETWLEGSGFSLSGLAVNGENVELGAMEAACRRQIEEIDSVDIVASTWAELMQQALVSTNRALEERIQSSAEAIPAIAAAWASSAAASFLAGRDRELHALVEAALEGMTPDVSAATTAVNERIQEIDDPRAELVSLASRLEPMALSLEDLPLVLQTGKDAQAAATLAAFAALASKLFRLVPLLKHRGIDLGDTPVDGNDFRSYIEELGTALKELISAYEGGDAVLVGDLAEYELAPRLRSLANALARALATAA